MINLDVNDNDLLCVCFRNFKMAVFLSCNVSLTFKFLPKIVLKSKVSQ